LRQGRQRRACVGSDRRVNAKLAAVTCCAGVGGSSSSSSLGGGGERAAEVARMLRSAAEQ
jgi:hypothetical protein